MIAGVSDQDGISGYLKATITQGDHVVTAYIGEGSSKTLTSNWTAPFESDSVGKAAMMEKTSSLGQSATDVTTVSKFNSQMVWEGTTPPTLNLTLFFQATNNPKAEVHDAIMLLEQFASPELHEMTPLGRVPLPVVVDIGRRIKISNVRIHEVTSELDTPRDKRGYMMRNTVQVTMAPAQMINASEIPGLYL
ncbi:TPA: hypothetical protein ACRTTK_003071 [Aeromonas hydrophila]|uniref:hypothetical protein n=1 Tax=Aeromonas hydrophila TaxID=644 RepID=UPI0024420E55|nr:hypothetical protein [Aeromonas hydrophila]